MQVLNLTVIDEYVNSLSFNGYFMAGNCVTNTIEGKDISGDIDLWVHEFRYFMQTFHEIIGDREFSVDIFPSSLIIRMDNIKPVNLIYSGESAEDTILHFDFDYCRAYYTPKLSKATNDCLKCLQTKIIRKASRFSSSRVEKALRYGYSFEREYQLDDSYKFPILQNITDIHIVRRAINTLIVKNPSCDARYEECMCIPMELNVDVGKHNFMCDFDSLFAMHPEQRHKIIMFGYEVEVQRWQSVYLNTPKYTKKLIDKHSYMYSGFDLKREDQILDKSLESKEQLLGAEDQLSKTPEKRYYDSEGNRSDYPIKYDYCTQGEQCPSLDIEAENEKIEISYTDLPVEFDQFLEFARSIDERFNQVIVNWYDGGLDYIAPHKDCPHGLIENAPIMMINLCESDDRVFMVQHKFIPLENGTYIIMRENYTHGVPKNQKSIGRRMSISFRCVELK